MGHIKEELTLLMDNHFAFTLPVGDGIPVSEAVVLSWIFMALLTVTAILFTRNLKVENPSRIQLAVEYFVEFMNGFATNNIGEHGKDFAPWLASVALYIGVCNLCGLFGFVPPTKNINVTIALAVSSVVLIYGSMFRYRGLKGGLHKFIEPSPIMLPINIMEIGIRPLSLCMRLFGNVLAAFVVMELVKLLVPVGIPVLFSLYFDIFDGLIQTVVFVFLTALFIGEGLEEEA